MTIFKNTKLGKSPGVLQKNKNKKLLAWTSTAITFALSACGRETRSTTEVPLADETSNTPTAFDDKLIGSDDLDTFTALAGDDEIYGFGGNDQIIAGTGNDTIYGGDGDDNIQPGAGDDTVYGEGGNDTIYLSAGADIEDGGDGIDTIIFGPDQTTLPVTINLDTGRYHFTSQIASSTQNLFSIENITSEGAADLTIYDTDGINVIATNTGNDTIHSAGGNDTITTGSGNDTVYLGSGTYTVDLGAGDDKVYLTTSASSINGNTGTDEAIVRAFDGFVDVYIDLKFSTYFVPSKLTAQDGMDVSLQNFEKVTIDGNVAATILGTASADTLLGMQQQTQLRAEKVLIYLQVGQDLINLFSRQVTQALPKPLLIQLQTLQPERIRLILVPLVITLKRMGQALLILQHLQLLQMHRCRPHRLIYMRSIILRAKVIHL